MLSGRVRTSNAESAPQDVDECSGTLNEAGRETCIDGQELELVHLSRIAVAPGHRVPKP